MAIPDSDTVVSNKTAKDIQQNIKITGNKVTGISLYVKEINNAGGDGNYLVIELPQAKDSENTVTCSFEGGNPTTLSTSDYQYLIKLNQKKPVTITVTGKIKATRTLDISELTLQTAKAVVPEKTVEMYGKTVEQLTTDLTLSNVDGVNKVGGKLNYVTDFDGFSKGAEGNFFPFQLEGTGTKMTFKKNDRVSKKDIDFEKNNVFKIGQKSDTWEVLVDNVSVAKFDFTNVELGTKEN